MKIKEGFVIKNIAGTNVVVPLGSNTVSFRAIITLNESGAFIWKQLETERTEDQLVTALINEYDIDEATARADIKELIGKMQEAELLV